MDVSDDFEENLGEEQTMDVRSDIMEDQEEAAQEAEENGEEVLSEEE